MLYTYRVSQKKVSKWFLLITQERLKIMSFPFRWVWGLTSGMCVKNFRRLAYFRWAWQSLEVFKKTPHNKLILANIRSAVG